MAGEAFSEYRFDELTLKSDLARGVEKVGYELMTPIQAAAIPVLLKGRDVIGQAKTGTGKTAAFGIPLLETVDPDSRKLQAVVLCPTRELAMQVAAQIRSCAVYMHDVKLLPVYGGQDIRTQITGLKGTQIIVGTPGRVMDHMNRHTIKMDDVKMVILDEADEMLQMGFREDMEFILGAIEHPHQTCLFSATMPQEILDITDRFQCNPELIRIESKELTIERIEQYYYAVKKEYKTQALLRLIAYYQYGKSMIFVNTKTMADELAHELKQEGYAADALHGDLSQKQRDIVMNAFRNGDTKILIATDIAARGIDVDDVEAVFNYDVPLETEYYVHRIGRTGRAGRAGVSHTLARSRDFRKIRDIETLCGVKMTEKRIPTPAAVNDARVGKVFTEVSAHIEDDGVEEYSRRIAGYCAKHEIPVETFAAAFLKMEVGDPVEELEIDLPQPEKPERRGKPDRHGRNERYGNEGRHYRDKDDRKDWKKHRDDGDSDRKDWKKHRDDGDSNRQEEKKERKVKGRIDWSSYQPTPATGDRHKDEYEKKEYKKKYKDGHRDRGGQKDRPKRKHGERFDVNFEGKRIYK